MVAVFQPHGDFQPIGLGQDTFAGLPGHAAGHGAGHGGRLLASSATDGTAGKPAQHGAGGGPEVAGPAFDLDRLDGLDGAEFHHLCLARFIARVDVAGGAGGAAAQACAGDDQRQGGECGSGRAKAHAMTCDVECLSL